MSQADARIFGMKQVVLDQQMLSESARMNVGEEVRQAPNMAAKASMQFHALRGSIAKYEPAYSSVSEKLIDAVLAKVARCRFELYVRKANNEQLTTAYRTPSLNSRRCGMQGAAKGHHRPKIGGGSQTRRMMMLIIASDKPWRWRRGHTTRLHLHDLHSAAEFVEVAANRDRPVRGVRPAPTASPRAPPGAVLGPRPAMHDLPAVQGPRRDSAVGDGALLYALRVGRQVASRRARGSCARRTQPFLTISAVESACRNRGGTRCAGTVTDRRALQWSPQLVVTQRSMGSPQPKESPQPPTSPQVATTCGVCRSPLSRHNVCVVAARPMETPHGAAHSP